MKTLDTLRRFLATRQGAYRSVFQGPLADKVLADLALFCRANDSTFHSDPRVSAMLDGRREVFLRIVQHLNLHHNDLFALSTGRSVEDETPKIDPEVYHD